MDKNTQSRTAVKWPVAYIGIVLMMVVGGSAFGAGCRTGEGSQPAQSSQETMSETYTNEEVKAVRTRTGFDEKAMRLDGVIGVGTGGNSPTESWISVLCTTEAARDSARQVLGTDVEGVPIHYRVTGVIRAQ